MCFCIWNCLIMRAEQLFLSSIDLATICQRAQTKWNAQLFRCSAKLFIKKFIWRLWMEWIVLKKYCFFMNERKMHRRLLWRLIRFHSHDKYDFRKAKEKTNRSTNSRSDCNFCQRKDAIVVSCAVHYYMDARINHNAYSHQPTNQQPRTLYDA